MSETTDYVYQNWLKDAYEDSKNSKDKVMLQLLHQMNVHLERIVELLESQGRVRPG